MPYRLSISRDVYRTINHLPGNIRQRIRRIIAGLATDPRPDAAKAMEGDLARYYRIRVDDYRIIYTIDDDVLMVEIARVTRRTPGTYGNLG